MARILRGEIRWADLNPVRGREQAGLRPVLILSSSIHKFDDVFIYSIRPELMAEGGTKCCPRRARPSRVSNRKDYTH